MAELILQPVLVIAAMERHGRGEVISSQLLLNLPLMLRLLVALAIGWAAPTDPLSLFVVGYLVSVTLAVGVAVALTPSPWPLPWRWRTPKTAEWRDASGYAVMNASTSGVAELDKILAIQLLSAGTAGVYAAASRIIGAVVLPVIAMMISAIPRLFRATSREGRKLHAWLFACAAAYGFMAALGVWLLAPFLSALFGAHYASMDEIIRWLAYAVPAISLRAAAANVLMTIDLPWTRVRLELSGWVGMALMACFMTLVVGEGERGLAFSVVVVEWALACTFWMVILLNQAKPEVRKRQ